MVSTVDRFSLPLNGTRMFAALVVAVYAFTALAQDQPIASVQEKIKACQQAALKCRCLGNDCSNCVLQERQCKDEAYASLDLNASPRAPQPAPQPGPTPLPSRDCSLETILRDMKESPHKHDEETRTARDVAQEVAVKTIEDKLAAAELNSKRLADQISKLSAQKGKAATKELAKTQKALQAIQKSVSLLKGLRAVAAYGPGVLEGDAANILKTAMSDLATKGWESFLTTAVGKKLATMVGETTLKIVEGGVGIFVDLLDSTATDMPGGGQGWPDVIRSSKTSLEDKQYALAKILQDIGDGTPVYGLDPDHPGSLNLSRDDQMKYVADLMAIVKGETLVSDCKAGRLNVPNSPAPQPAPTPVPTRP